MKNFYFLFIYLVHKIICDYETLNLSLQNSYYYILSPEYPSDAMLEIMNSYYFPDSALEAHISDL